MEEKSKSASFIRPAVRDDKPAIMALSVASGLFTPDELGELEEMIDACFEGALGEGHTWIVYDRGEGPAGVAYYGPEQFSDDVYNLYMIAVQPDQQGSGVGTKLLHHVEKALINSNARMLLIDTSSLGSFALTRAFYRKNNYDEEARIRDYYAAGDDKVTFRKVLASVST